MAESRIELTTRLQKEGRWAEATLFKDGQIRELRSGGMNRALANEEAWRRMAAMYPPQCDTVSGAFDEECEGPDVDFSQDPFTDALSEAATQEIDSWQTSHGITLPPEARDSLIAEVVMYSWTMGWIGSWIGTERQEPPFHLLREE